MESKSPFASQNVFSPLEPRLEDGADPHPDEAEELFSMVVSFNIWELSLKRLEEELVAYADVSLSGVGRYVLRLST